MKLRSSHLEIWGFKHSFLIYIIIKLVIRKGKNYENWVCYCYQDQRQLQQSCGRILFAVLPCPTPALPRQHTLSSVVSSGQTPVDWEKKKPGWFPDDHSFAGWEKTCCDMWNCSPILVTLKPQENLTIFWSMTVITQQNDLYSWHLKPDHLTYSQIH